ncbi:probable C-mannosyltransferase DPY19L3 isoform X2 [Gadus macrocephalus]|uniref:probable C-mannosyltransferase DPY19L3 isoform X2 n=1 Tax=Gadus macrocephalus TaxID=80720 RepID=UPI0028CB2AE6|nr:probable C-mannosyltransferase DPY19L3 isoform X2 [Gadus macrocephalus]XP_059926725.1 probable C-mannosyltransferase DPY19L3 isoform X2 [Gadus macrocephalus]XP_059926726.1 probable C-mannosyltransferase DPY19L3 isoform X2 [Gadus macrocephalus]XP_059926727.1 probable C-mannosyltransferase DPY19L3 isoform X2 [Gadus macrocephalus]
MTALRQRKGSRARDPPLAADIQKPLKTNCCPDHRADSRLHGDWSWGAIVWTSIGWSVSVGLGLLCCIYVATLHENDLWFSNIKEVEREISFRTECGLYYSYYKQMLQAPTIGQGLWDLVHDNMTESKRTINLLQRMNIYQEVFLSVLYRVLPIEGYLEPIYFYIYTVFSLQAVYVIALYLTAWLLSGTWLAGVLAAVWYILNRVDTTRVEFTISLRENWSMPFLALQVAAITCYLRPQLSALLKRVMVWLVFVTSVCFCLTWQFNQFILLVQALVLFSMDALDLISARQVTTLYLVQVCSLLCVWLLQFCNSMILGSLVLSFIMSALFVKYYQPGLKSGGLLARLAKLVLHTLLVLSLTGVINYFTKKALQVRSDEHIFKFIKSKFGLGPTRDFDASLYLCEDAFGPLPMDTLERLGGTLLLYPYVLTMGGLIAVLAVVALRNLSGSKAKEASVAEEERKGGGGGGGGGEVAGASAILSPDLAYNLLHTLFFGLLAFSTMRMKYIWTGHMCAVATYSVCAQEPLTLVLRLIRCHSKTMIRIIRCVVPLVLIGCLYVKFWPQIMKEVSELREFYDPDTVELMNWISSDTPQRAVFAGSMQLLAGIKLCTGRVLTNHPHYEDRDLRERTKQVYQVYAQRSPEEVHRVLRAAGADYVVLEDSVCYERRHARGCRLRDLLDLDNGHIMDGPGENDPDLVPASNPRFCEAVKTDSPVYSALFTQAFRNKTFHVYRLKKKRKRGSKSSAEPTRTH